MVAQIMDYTCGLRDNGEWADPFFEFDKINNKIYFTYNTKMAGWDIPIEEVEAFLE